MNTPEMQTSDGGFSMRRTFLTLLGGFAAFAILTASYATADLTVSGEAQASSIVAVD